MAETLGIYIHIPFCSGGKCPYCDFYSVKYDKSLAERYIEALKASITVWGRRASGRTVDTVYFGGGTPTVLGNRLAEILKAVKDSFDVSGDAEITFEANPGVSLSGCVGKLKDAGFNRISIGMQSAVQEELGALGRRHSTADVRGAVEAAKGAGISNISLDIMLCTPAQSIESLEYTVQYAASLEPAHISAYLLKIEAGTAFEKQKESLCLPSDDEQAEYYLKTCGLLKKYGFRQYEISNFSKPGYESRHNLKYWNCMEYIGIGPAAHSFFNGRRFYYTRDLNGFLNGRGTVDDGPGGGFEEYCMLALRLSRGLCESELRRRFGRGFESFDGNTLLNLENGGFLINKGGFVRLTEKGFLVSNSVISSLVF